MKDEEIAPLPTDVEALQNIVLSLRSEINSLSQKHEQLLEKFRLAQHQRFGQSSEKADKDAPVQGDLFNEAEVLIDEDEKGDEDTEKESISYTRKKPKRKPLPKDLPRI